MVFVAEYVTAMKPLAQALDIHQCEMKVYMAYLVSTIMAVKEKNAATSTEQLSPVLQAAGD